MCRPHPRLPRRDCLERPCQPKVCRPPACGRLRDAQDPDLLQSGLLDRLPCIFERPSPSRAHPTQEPLLKNIALLYELWTFFRLVSEISEVLGSPPVRSGRLASDLFQTAFAAGGTCEWDRGVRLVYNQSFSRSRKGQRHSYSVPLIPDIALSIPDGPNAGLHLFDAKFRVQALTDVGLAADGKDDNDEKAAERAGSFKRADIHKMHAYRDAIPDARSVCILYPGGKFRFFGVPGSGVPSGHRPVSSPEGLPGELTGVGAIPIARVVVGEGAMAADW